MKKKILIALLAVVFTVLPLTPVLGAQNDVPRTLYEYFGGNLPSVQERAVEAAKYGIFGYAGSFDQNVQFLSILNKIEKESGEKVGFSVVTNYQTTLSSSMTSSQITVPVSTVTTKDGHVLTMDDLGGKVYFVIEPGANKEEIVKCTTLSGTTWGTCTRGLAFYGTSTTAVTANKKTHNSGSTVVMSNVHYIYDELVDKDSDETIAGVKTYTSIPLIPTTAPTLNTQTTSKAYVDGLIAAGVATSTETVFGGGKLATRTEASEGTFDASDPKFLYSGIATSSPVVATSSVVVSESDGNINQAFLDLTEDFDFTGSLQSSGNEVLTGVIFGNSGSDGASTTVANVSLTSDVYYTDLTVASGTTLTTNGYRIFATGTITVEENGVIDYSGNDGTAGGDGGVAADATGCAGTAGTGGALLVTNSLYGSGAGKAGKAGGEQGSVNGIAGEQGASALNATEGVGVAGGDGGAGGGGHGGNASTGGIAGELATASTTVNIVPTLLYDFNGRFMARAGSGSGGSGARGSTGCGGEQEGCGGGSGGSASNGGTIMMMANTIINAGIISANGGDGGDGGLGGNPAITADGGSGGGGAGGSGGLITLVYKTLINNGTISVSIGTGGTGGAAQGAGGAGDDGEDGNLGAIYQIQL